MKTSADQQRQIRQLQRIFRERKEEISYRLGEFSNCLAGQDESRIFSELAFCLLTPQSKARCCWDAVCAINNRDMLLTGTEADIRGMLFRVRFHNKKAHYVVQARELFMTDEGLAIKAVLQNFPDSYQCREWLVRTIKGLGYKEASHFLRNVGFGNSIAILDRHILRNLVRFGVIQNIPSSLGRMQYLKIEKKMSAFARTIRIPWAYLDLLLWYRETGEIFK